MRDLQGEELRNPRTLPDWKINIIYALLDELQSLDVEAAARALAYEDPKTRANREQAELEAIKRKVFGDNY